VRSAVLPRSDNVFRAALLSLFSHRTLALLRWDLHFARVRAANRLAGSARTLSRRVAAMPRPRYLNLGSGPRGVCSPNWLNVDGFRDANVHYVIDFTRRLPLPAHSFDAVFCEHVLEHFAQEDGIRLLTECVRVLVPGGCARFIMPDAERIVTTYVSSPATLLEKRSLDSAVPMEAVNSWFRQRYEHQCLYDWQMAEKTFRSAGFSRVERGSFRASRCAPDDVLIDDEKYAWESLYVDAVT